MRELMQKFAQFVIARLERLISDYTIVRRLEPHETWMEATARGALLWLLEWVTAKFDRFPWLNPMTRRHVHDEFERIVEYLRSDGAHDIYGGAT